MSEGPFEFTADLFRWDGAAAWHFVALPDALGDLIAVLRPRDRPGFGAVPVEVAVGPLRWRTSVFPDSGRGTYLLPVKAAVRERLGVGDGDPLAVSLSLR